MARPGRLSIIAAFAAVYVIWGSTYLAILFAIRTIPPFLMAGVRFFLAGSILYTVARLRRAPAPPAGSWKSAAIVGGLLLLCGNGGVTISEQWVPSGLAAVLVATVPIDVALLGWLIGTAPRPTPMAIVGLVGGFLGVGVLVGPALTGPAVSGNAHFGLGVLILLIGSLLWSAGSIYSSNLRQAPSLIVAAGQQMICGGIMLGLAGLLLGEHHRLDVHSISWLSTWAFVYLVFVGAIVGYTAYFFLLRHCEPAKVATYAYINPVVALLLGSLLADERLSLRMMIGAGLIIVSVAIVIGAQQIMSRSEFKTSAELKVADVNRKIAC